MKCSHCGKTLTADHLQDCDGDLSKISKGLKIALFATLPMRNKEAVNSPFLRFVEVI